MKWKIVMCFFFFTSFFFFDIDLIKFPFMFIFDSLICHNSLCLKALVINLSQLSVSKRELFMCLTTSRLRFAYRDNLSKMKILPWFTNSYVIQICMTFLRGTWKKIFWRMLGSRQYWIPLIFMDRETNSFFYVPKKKESHISLKWHGMVFYFWVNPFNLNMHVHSDY